MSNIGCAKKNAISENEIKGCFNLQQSFLEGCFYKTQQQPAAAIRACQPREISLSEFLLQKFIHSEILARVTRLFCLNFAQ